MTTESRATGAPRTPRLDLAPQVRARLGCIAARAAQREDLSAQVALALRGERSRLRLQTSRGDVSAIPEALRAEWRLCATLADERAPLSDRAPEFFSLASRWELLGDLRRAAALRRLGTVVASAGSPEEALTRLNTLEPPTPTSTLAASSASMPSTAYRPAPPPSSAAPDIRGLRERGVGVTRAMVAAGVFAALALLVGSMVAVVARLRRMGHEPHEPEAAVTRSPARPWRAMAPAAPPEPPTNLAPPPPPASEPPVAAQPASRPRPVRITASSFVAHRRHSFPPEHAFDFDLRTAWNEGAPGPGVGEWIEAEYAHTVVVREVRASTGWDAVSRRGVNLFEVNSHLSRATLLLDSVEAGTRSASPEQRGVVFEVGGRTATRVRLRADAVWPGTHYEDLCISEILIVAEDPAGTEPVAAPPPAPSPEPPALLLVRGESSRCTLVQPVPFHLRATPTVGRDGSVPMPSGTSVVVLDVTEVRRRRSRLVRVRVPSSGQEGYMFLTPVEMATCGIAE